MESFASNATLIIGSIFLFACIYTCLKFMTIQLIRDAHRSFMSNSSQKN